MPFEPLKPDEMKRWGDMVCQSPEHNPPTHIVIFEPTAWVCPQCGNRTVIYPTRVTC